MAYMPRYGDTRRREKSSGREGGGAGWTCFTLCFDWTQIRSIPSFLPNCCAFLIVVWCEITDVTLVGKDSGNCGCILQNPVNSYQAFLYLIKLQSLK